MSLSKYYKSSDSFKAEEIVKQDKDEKAGWESDPLKEKVPFESQKLHSADLEREQRDKAPQPPDNHLKQDHLTQENHEIVEEPVLKEQATELEIEPEDLESVIQPPKIDLRNYMDIKEANALIEEAYQKGLEEGKFEADEDYGAATRALLSVCQQLDTIRETIIANSGQELQNFALSVAERIIRMSVQEQDHTILATIEEALQRSVRSDEFTIFVHPDDYDVVFAKSNDLIAGVTGLNNVVIKTDITLDPGGARIESDNCTIDATLASQFDVIREEVQKKL